MILSLVFLVFGLAVLVKGADYLVDGAVIIAERFHVPPLVIGLTIVAFGTSAPELAVNITTALNPEVTGIGMGNIIGSNIANIGLIIGLTALITPLVVKKVITNREIPFMILSGIVFLVLVSDMLLGQGVKNSLSQGDGAILLLFFVIFIYYLLNAVIQSRQARLSEEFSQEYQKTKTSSSAKGWGLFLLGLFGVVWGGQLVVNHGADVARAMGISEILIGLSLIAIGTSLPELATSITAALKKESDIAVGNVVGSNIFNTFFILGINAVISPIPFQNEWFLDLGVMILFSAILLVASFTSRRIKRSEGVVMLLAYLSYMVFIIMRG